MSLISTEHVHRKSSMLSQIVGWPMSHNCMMSQCVWLQLWGQISRKFRETAGSFPIGSL